MKWSSTSFVVKSIWYFLHEWSLLVVLHPVAGKMKNENKDIAYVANSSMNIESLHPQATGSCLHPEIDSF